MTSHKTTTSQQYRIMQRRSKLALVRQDGENVVVVAVDAKDKTFDVSRAVLVQRMTVRAETDAPIEMFDRNAIHAFDFYSATY